MPLSSYTKELISLSLAAGVPLAGVILLGWDAHAVMFILCWEMTVTSAGLLWLFDYPNRSTLRGLLFVALASPWAYLMSFALNASYGDWRYRMGEMILDLSAVTWPSLLFLTFHAVRDFRIRMRVARKQGASMDKNDRILIRWLFRVVVPATTLLLVLAWWKELRAQALAAILFLKALVDLGYLLYEQGAARRKTVEPLEAKPGTVP